MKVKCPGCGGIFQLKPEMAGKKVKCRCSQVFQTGALPASQPAPRPDPNAVDPLLRQTSRGPQRPPQPEDAQVYATSSESKIVSVGIVGCLGVMFLIGSVALFFALDDNYQFKGRNLLITSGFMLLSALWFIFAAIDSARYRISVGRNSIEAKSLFKKQRIDISKVAYVECNNGMVFRFRDRNEEELGSVTSFFRGLGEFDRWVKGRFDCSVYGKQY